MFMPIPGFFCSLMVPLPVLFYRVKLGRSAGMLVPVSSLILLGAFMGGLSLDLLFYAELLLTGYILGELVILNLSIEKTVIYACGITVLAVIVSLAGFGHISHTGIVALVTQYVSKNLELTLGLYQNMGISEENLHMISSAKETIGYILVRILPALIIALSLLVSWLNLILSRPVLKSRGIAAPDFGPLLLWKAPDWLVWMVIGFSVLLLFPEKTVKMFGLNGLIVLMTIYFLGGIAIVSFYFEKKRFPRILRVILYGLIVFEQLALFLVIGLGFFDIWLNFRKIQIGNNN